MAVFATSNFNIFRGSMPPDPLAGSPFGGGSGLRSLNFRTQVPTFRMQVKTGLEKTLQALPALKVAIDDECSEKGRVFTKTNQPDLYFVLLFLAHFARFSIRTENEATVHTHSQTNRHLRLFPAASRFQC